MKTARVAVAEEAPLLGGIVLVVVRGLDAGDVGGEEVDAVAVEVAAGSVVVFGGSWVAWRSRIWASRRGTPASRALVIAVCLSEWG